MDWIMYTVGMVAHIWVVMVIIGLLTLTKNHTIVPWKIVTPFILLIAYWNWYFFG